MSTLEVSSINTTSIDVASITDGTNTFTPEQGAKGTTKAWVNFNGTGTVSIRNNYNVSSITDLGTGYYRVNFASALSSASYAVHGSCCKNDTVNDGNAQVQCHGFNNGANNVDSTTSTYIVTCQAASATKYDPAHVSVAVVL